MATAAFLRPEEEKLFEGQPKVNLSMLMFIDVKKSWCSGNQSAFCRS